MRLRFVSTTYFVGSASQSLERHYRELRDDLLRQGRNFGLLQQAPQWRPPMDIHETPDAILVKLEVAGVREDEIDVALYSNALVVTGRRDDDSDHDEELCYHEAQVHYGPFRAEMLLPSPVHADDASATYANGFLRIHLPKAARSEPGTSGAHESNGEQRGAGSPSGHLDAAPAPSQSHTTPHILRPLKPIRSACLYDR